MPFLNDIVLLLIVESVFRFYLCADSSHSCTFFLVHHAIMVRTNTMNPVCSADSMRRWPCLCDVLYHRSALLGAPVDAVEGAASPHTLDRPDVAVPTAVVAAAAAAAAAAPL